MQTDIELLRSRTIYKMLMIVLGIFTLLDITITRIGLNLGCVELNTFVNNLGLDIWSIFRLILLFYLLAIYSIGYKIFQFRSAKGLWILKNSLYAIDIFIGAIVFSGIFHIITRLTV